MGERFGAPPWEIEDAPLDRKLFYLRVMAAEADGLERIEGLSDDQDADFSDLDEEETDDAGHY